MAMLQVILTNDVDKLGRAGEVVSVKPGYGRNYLLPRGLALPATKANMRQLEHHRRSIQAAQAKIRAEHEAAAAKVKEAIVSIPRKVGKEDKMYGSVSTKDIAEALSAQNVDIDRKIIKLDEPIKTVGSHEVTVRFSAEVSVPLKVEVIAVPA
ncbi:ribosomal protein L9 [Plesiocystis pacifica SIR-1]|uniref:Large ribosomal subunit protein bL9 n=1 Tax=Plesiocystis pacifica SIR-1 TaxID=391625 RepID=A6G1R2_9BACT|nr:ribosomal protein L9 [Plesiocystis pacifica SIR-1]